MDSVIDNLSDNELKEIFNPQKYDKEVIIFIEYFGTYVVSQFFNSIYNQSLVAQSKNEENGRHMSMFDSYEKQLLRYGDSIQTIAGIDQELKKFHNYYNQKTKKMDSFENFCFQFAAAFTPSSKKENLKDPVLRMKVVNNAFRTILTYFINEVNIGMLSIVITGRKDPKSPQKLQTKFLEVALLHKFAEHKKWLAPSNSKTGINNDIINKMSKMIENMKNDIGKLTVENKKLKKLLIKQDRIIKTQLQEIAALNKQDTPKVEEIEIPMPKLEEPPQDEPATAAPAPPEEELFEEQPSAEDLDHFKIDFL